MARVPISRGAQVALAPLPSEKLRATDVTAVGRAIGEGMENLGQGVAQFAEQQDRIEAVHDQAAVKEAANAVTKRYAELGYTGQDAYYSKNGKDALLARPAVETSLDSLIEQTKKALRTQRQRDMFDNAMIPQRTSWGVQIANHADKETQRYETDESTSRLGLSGELARSTYIQDPEDGERQIGTGLTEIENLGRMAGWGPERIATEKLKFTSGVYRDIGQRLVYEGEANGPALAQAFVDQHGGSMVDDDREAVLNHARVYQNTLEAEQRRVENEKKTELREQKAEAKDRANSVLRNIADGVVVEPQMLASALSDAKFAEDPALEEGLRQGGLKNGLTQQWANATPAELQDRVNQLSAEITQAGGKVEADKVVERDHLETLLSKSSTDLSSDPLSWGARHLGIPIGQLNLKDSASVTARISAATQISRRTGQRPKPLTNEEAAALAPQVVHGSVADRVKLSMRLAGLGPLALSAAQQVAPNNPGFHALVGLAGHANAGVAASRVNQVVSGQEILKSNPKLLDKAAAIRLFDESTGGALRLLPSVRAGVIENAYAILANDANERGIHEWGDASPRWYAAINSALGAYSKNGEQIGGLTKLNGEITIAPENMAVGDFERRIGRAQAPQLKAAHNATPIYRDGTTPTASQIKKMQWVPIRDGVYRISDGSRFLETREGGFYEIDARKLR